MAGSELHAAIFSTGVRRHADIITAGPAPSYTAAGTEALDSRAGEKTVLVDAAGSGVRAVREYLHCSPGGGDLQQVAEA